MVTTPPIIGRRRALKLFAAAGASLAIAPVAADARGVRRWAGAAMGAEAQMLFAGADAPAVDRAIVSAQHEIERLENEFSLYRPQSALARLNRDGILAQPSADMRALLHLAIRLGNLSQGAFDASMQPLWACYARHFHDHPGDGRGPAPSALAAAQRHVDYRRISVTAERIRIGPGMALTLNGIAQGYVSDRVAELLRRQGWSNVLVELGELRALGGREPDRDWQIDTPMGRQALRNRAMAISAPGGTLFEPGGRFHHLIDPRTGRPSDRYRSVIVTAERADIADGLSTALSMLSLADATRLLQHFPTVSASVVLADGAIRSLSYPFNG
jgi:thiamine biosynthesis lipoprotein